MERLVPLVILFSFLATPIKSNVITCEGLDRCPFDDLTPDEISRTLQIIKAFGPFPGTIKYPIIRTQEPKKEDWLSQSAAGYVRRAYAALFDMTSNLLVEMVIDLEAGRVTDITQQPDGVSPAMMNEEFDEAERLIRSNAQWLAAIQARGLEPDDAVLDVWAPGLLAAEEQSADGRLVRAITNFRNPKSRFSYWSVVEGLIVTVDLHNHIVISVWDDERVNMTSGIEELPNFDDKPFLQPLQINQPSGTSIQVEGQRLSWYKWKLHYSMDPIFGLQLRHVTYNADCEQRMVLYKANMAEMFVPYGGKGRAWRWRSAFDAGEYGIGKNVNQLTIGLDVPENAVLFNCTAVEDDTGEPYIIQGCVAAYERDSGLLYKHTDYVSGDVDGRRGRALVLTMMTTIGNYDYTFDYIFQMDGALEIRSRLTGIVLARGVSEANTDEGDCIENCTTFINDYLVGPPHQHFFNYRIDFDIDGHANHFLETDVTADPVSPENPDPGVFSAKKRLVAVEGFHDHDFQAQRSWHVINAASRNVHGSPRGYALRPETFSYTYLTDSSPILGHAQFVKHPVWVTSYKDKEQTPADKFPRTGRAGEGLPKYMQDNESVLNEDVVVWYTYGVTHCTRAEEWPIMNVHNAGFSIVPYNFQSQNSEMPLKDKCP